MWTAPYIKDSHAQAVCSKQKFSTSMSIGNQGGGPEMPKNHTKKRFFHTTNQYSIFCIFHTLSLVVFVNIRSLLVISLLMFLQLVTDVDLRQAILLSIVIHHPILSIVIQYYPLLSIIIHYHLLLSIIIHYYSHYPLLSIVIHYYSHWPLLSTDIKAPKLKLASSQ